LTALLLLLLPLLPPPPLLPPLLLLLLRQRARAHLSHGPHRELRRARVILARPDFA
jgi:hypothetical protein